MKILYVTTIGGTMDFFVPFIKQLLKEGNTVDIATNENNSKVPECYKEWGCTVYQIDTSRSPLNRGNIKAITQIKELVAKEEYDIVHCHTPVAAMCTRLACRKARKNGTRVFYTAHGFHFYKGAPLKNWMLYYPVEKICAHFTDVLITINQEDYALAQKKMKAKHVEYVPGVGVDTERFYKLQLTDSEKKEIRNEMGVPQDAMLLASVGELNANKNHEVILRAMSLLGDNRIHYVIAGVGPKEEYLKALAKRLGLEERLHLLGYRRDIDRIYKVADICCFPSIREGLGLAAIEGMACGLPLVAAGNRGTRDYCENHVHGFLCSPTEPQQFADAIGKVLSDSNLYQAMAKNNVAKSAAFEVSHICNEMQKIYFE